MSTVAIDRELGELMLFISERSEGDSSFGALKLNKLLFYGDFLAYLTLGASVTGQEYEKLEHGPAPRRLSLTRDALIADGSLAVRKAEPFNRKQERTFALREPDLSTFSAEQIALVTRLIEDNWGKHADEVSAPSPQFRGWEEAVLHETIPYEVTLVARRAPVAAERAKCLEDLPKAAVALKGFTARRDA